MHGPEVLSRGGSRIPSDRTTLSNAGDERRFSSAEGASSSALLLPLLPHRGTPIPAGGQGGDSGGVRGCRNGHSFLLQTDDEVVGVVQVGSSSAASASSLR